MTTLAEFYDMLERHDWYFDYSDDGSVWRAGLAASKKLGEIAKESPEHTALHQAYAKHMFTGKPWNNEKAPKPERPTGE